MILWVFLQSALLNLRRCTADFPFWSYHKSFKFFPHIRPTYILNGRTIERNDDHPIQHHWCWQFQKWHPFSPFHKNTLGSCLLSPASNASELECQLSIPSNHLGCISWMDEGHVPQTLYRRGQEPGLMQRGACPPNPSYLNYSPSGSWRAICKRQIHRYMEQWPSKSKGYKNIVHERW